MPRKLNSKCVLLAPFSFVLLYNHLCPAVLVQISGNLGMCVNGIAHSITGLYDSFDIQDSPWRGFPWIITKFIRHSRKLEYCERPDLNYIKVFISKTRSAFLMHCLWLNQRKIEKDVSLPRKNFYLWNVFHFRMKRQPCFFYMEYVTDLNFELTHYY